MAALAQKVDARVGLLPLSQVGDGLASPLTGHGQEEALGQSRSVVVAIVAKTFLPLPWVSAKNPSGLLRLLGHGKPPDVRSEPLQQGGSARAVPGVMRMPLCKENKMLADLRRVRKTALVGLL
jgi:hypothetical protein